MSVMPDEEHKKHFRHVTCNATTESLRISCSEWLPIKDVLHVLAQCETQWEELRISVVPDAGRNVPVLLVRDWLEKLRLERERVREVSQVSASRSHMQELK